MNKQNEFKAGDKVYYPLKSNKIYKLEAHKDAHYLLRVVDKDGSVASFFTCGKFHYYDSIPSIFHATEKNQAALEQLYGIEFEKPTPTPTPRQVLADQYIGDIREIGAYFPNSNMRKAVIVAALVMAKNAGVCSDILRKFVNVLVTGICHEHKDQTIIILRDKVIKGEFSKGGSSAREDYLNKIQNSINNYAQGRAMQIVSNTKKLTYPYLPYNK